MLSRDGHLYHALRKARNRAAQVLKHLDFGTPTAFVSFKAKVARDTRLGEFAFIGPGCVIPPKVSIGQYSMLAAEVVVVGDDHEWAEVGTPMQFSRRPRQRATHIGDDVWVGRRAILMRGVTIGDSAIVAAGAIVTKSIPAGEIWGGIPARKLRDRFGSIPDLEAHIEQIKHGPAVANFASPLRNL